MPNVPSSNRPLLLETSVDRGLEPMAQASNRRPVLTTRNSVTQSSSTFQGPLEHQP